MATSDWYPDPANRYQFRYFDGTLWTSHVSSNGVATEDTIPVGQPAEWQWTFCRHCQAICQFDDDHCWKCVSSFPENRVFGSPPQPAHGAPIQSQYESAQRAVAGAFESAERALAQGRPKDALRGFDEALWHRHFAEQFLMQLPKSGTSYGLGVSVLTMGLGPTDLIVGPLVRGFVNKRIQNRREQDVAGDRLIIQAHGLLALTHLPEYLDKQGIEHEVLVRFAFAYQPPGVNQPIDHGMADNQLKHFIGANISRIQAAYAELNGLLADYSVFYQWLDLGQILVGLGFPIGNLLTGERARHGDSAGSASSSSATNTRDALAVLGLKEHASDDEIKKAYREMTKKFHPDLHTGSSPDVQQLIEDKMRQVNAAYELLTRTG